MDVHADDDGFVRAPVALVYRHLTDLPAYPSWWPGFVLRGSSADRYDVELHPPGVTGRLRLQLTTHGWRHEQGFRMTLTGDLEGEAEWWLEPGWGGTVVHHLLAARTTGDPRRVLRTYRASLRHGLWASKDRLQTVTRAAIGMSA